MAVVEDRHGGVRIGHQRIEGKRLDGLRAATGQGGAHGKFLLLRACRQHGGDRLGQRTHSKSGDPGSADDRRDLDYGLERQVGDLPPRWAG